MKITEYKIEDINIYFNIYVHGHVNVIENLTKEADNWDWGFSSDISDGCISCEESSFVNNNFCPNSNRRCKHHCNHYIWTHDKCCWCGQQDIE